MIHTKGKHLCHLLPLIIATILFLTACSFNKKRYNPTAENQCIDQIYNQLQDSIYTNPQYVLDAIDSLQNCVTDSSNYYRLKLFRANIYSDNRLNPVEAYDEVYKYCQRHNDTELELIYWNYYGNYIMLNLGLRDSALTCYEKAYNIVVGSHDKMRFVNICINLADAYRLTGNPVQASLYYRKAQITLDSIGSQKNIFNVYTGLGQTYADIANYPEAEKYFDLAGTILDSVSIYDKFFYHNSYGNELYLALRYDDALEQFKLAATYAYEMKHIASICISETNLCEVNMMLGNMGEARYHLDQAMTQLKQLPYEALTKFYIYSLAGDIALHENNLETAQHYFSEAGDTSIVGPREMALHYSRLHRLYAKMHDYNNAYHYMQRATYYDDLINNNHIYNQLLEIELRYRQDATIMQQRLEISEKEIQVHTLTIHIFIIILAALLIISFIIIYAMHKSRQRSMTEIALRQSIYAMRLANIRNRISPHFIFNVLNRELKHDNPGIENLVKLLRNNLQLCDRYIIPLTEELSFVDTYIATEAPSLGDNFHYTKHIPCNINTDDIIIPSMMVQIFVENAVKHGLRGYPGDKYLNIKVMRLDDATTIIIENQGGSPTGCINTNSSTGTGMKVVTQTINLLNEHNVRKMDIFINHQQDTDEQPTIYTVTITIPDGFDFTSIKN